MKHRFDACTNELDCNQCDIGYVLAKYVTPLMQTLTNDIRDYYMRFLTTKCLNTAVMLSVFMLGKERGIAVANYCDIYKTRERHQRGEDSNRNIVSDLRRGVLNKNFKKRQFYYILLTDGNFPYEEEGRQAAFFPGHVFIIEKILSKVPGDPPIYYIYQSYINQYDLKKHRSLNKSLRLSVDKLQTILSGLDYILNQVSVWDEECVRFWKELTFIDTSELIGSQCKGNIFLCVKNESLDACLTHINRYVKEKMMELRVLLKTHPEKAKDIYGDSTLYEESPSAKALSNGEMLRSLASLYQDIVTKLSNPHP